MKQFPDLQIDNDAYRAELIRHIDNPLRRAVCEALWHGTKQYQAMIARDGVSVQQSILGQLRAEIRQFEFEIDTLTKAESSFAADADRLRKQAKELSGERRSYRGHDGLRHEVDNSDRVARLATEAMACNNLANRAISTAASKRQQLSVFKQADERIGVALLVFMESELVRQATPVAPPAPPVFNVRVEAPVVNLEATIDVPPPEVSISLPDRRTVGTIERDHNGNIIRTEQIETTA